MGYLYAAFLRSPIEAFGFPRSYEVGIRTYTPCVSCGSVACQGAVLYRVFRSTPPGVLLPEDDSWRLKILFATYAFSIDRVPQGMNSRCDLCSSLQGLVDGLSSGQSLHFTVTVRMHGPSMLHLDNSNYSATGRVLSMLMYTNQVIRDFINPIASQVRKRSGQPVRHDPIDVHANL